MAQIIQSKPVNLNEKKDLVTLISVLNKLNTDVPRIQQINIEKLKQVYKNKEDITGEVEILLQESSIDAVKSFSLANKLWLCQLQLTKITDKAFEGVGRSKSAAEYNSLLAAMLWLKELDAASKLRNDILYFSGSKRMAKETDNCGNKKPENNNELIKNHSVLTKNLNFEFGSHIFPFLRELNTLSNELNILSKVQKSYIQARFFSSTSKVASKGTELQYDKRKDLNAILSEKEDVSDSVISINSKDNNGTNGTTPVLEEPQAELHHFTLQNYKEVHQIHEKFPVPKQTLHNFYQILQSQLHDKTIKAEVSYKPVKQGKRSYWVCTYHLNWPENCKVSAKELTKRKASDLAALKVLALLLENKKITPDGMPIIYTKQDIKVLTQKNEKEVVIGTQSVKHMQNIICIFNEKLKDIVGVDYSYKDNLDGLMEDPDSSNRFWRSSPKYYSKNTYLAKEKFDLPFSKYKEDFIELCRNNKCIIVKGQPGCGKSTRAPQYVLEMWAREASLKNKLCRIAVTQPRRIAAISIAERIAAERDEKVGDILGYQVRLKTKFQPTLSRILFCTTGILLRHLQGDPKLSNFSHVILDEAHERDLNIDLLMNLLKKAMKENDALKVIVMSATIDAEEFSKYFDNAPIFEVPGFSYPVKKYYLDSCKLDVSKTLKMCSGEHPQVIHEDAAKVVEYIHESKPEGAILVFLPGWDDLTKVQSLISPLRNIEVHMLHSKLKDSEQHKIFARPAPGVRKIILSTNIAETSITIDDVVYVVDSGMHKDQLFDNDKGINVIDMEWISKASANQRSGRAGRCSPGESYHLYSREKYNSFSEYTTPKILNSSLTKVVLDSKLFANNLSASDFMNSLITPPESNAVERAVDELKQLDLLDDDEKLTPLGRALVNFQMEPNLAKTMVNSVIFKCTTPVVDIVTLFCGESEMFGSLTLMNKGAIKDLKQGFSKTSDHLALMRIYEKWLELLEERNRYEANDFCLRANLVPHKMNFISKLQNIHYSYLHNGLLKSMIASDDFSDNDELVKAVLYSGIGKILTHRNWDMVKNRLKTNVNVLVTRDNHKATITSDSVNYKRHKFPSDFLLYINETRSNIRRTTIVRECSIIPPISVLLFCNKSLEVRPIQSGNSEENVYVSIKNTNLKFILNREEAETLLDCKMAIEASYKFLIHQLTYAEGDITDFLHHWQDILINIDSILLNHKIK